MSDKLNDTQKIFDEIVKYHKTCVYDVEVSAKIIMDGNDYVNMFRIEKLTFENLEDYKVQFERLLRTILNAKFLNDGGDL